VARIFFKHAIRRRAARRLFRRLTQGGESVRVLGRSLRNQQCYRSRAGDVRIWRADRRKRRRTGSFDSGWIFAPC